MYTHVQACSTIYNEVQACTTFYNHVQPCTTLYNHLQSCTTMYNHLQSCTTLNNHLQASTTMKNQYHAATTMKNQGSCNPIQESGTVLLLWTNQSTVFGHVTPVVDFLLDIYFPLQLSFCLIVYLVVQGWIQLYKVVQVVHWL